MCPTLNNVLGIDSDDDLSFLHDEHRLQQGFQASRVLLPGDGDAVGDDVTSNNILIQECLSRASLMLTSPSAPILGNCGRPAHICVLANGAYRLQQILLCIGASLHLFVQQCVQRCSSSIDCTHNIVSAPMRLSMSLFYFGVCSMVSASSVVAKWFARLRASMHGCWILEASELFYSLAIWYSLLKVVGDPDLLTLYVIAAAAAFWAYQLTVRAAAACIALMHACLDIWISPNESQFSEHQVMKHVGEGNCCFMSTDAHAIMPIRIHNAKTRRLANISR